MELEHHFKSVQILRDQPLGIGAYGKVCKAKCDDLLCAAKMIHAVLFDVQLYITMRALAQSNNSNMNVSCYQA